MTDDDKKKTSRCAPRKRSKSGKTTAKAKTPARASQAKRDNRAQVATDAQREQPRQPEPQQPAPPPGLAVIPMHVRWRDLDAFNHVNNSSYLTFLEEARLQWLRTVPGEWFHAHAMPVMAAVELHYRKPIEWPAEVDVQLNCERLGNSSVTIGNRIVDRNDASVVYADGNVVMVWIDPATGASVPLPDAIRKACS
jgi:acyl-CoA thioester hydrolase